MRNSEVGRTGAVRPLWSEADSLRERVADAPALFGFFSFDAALAQRASHGHLRTNPAARAALIRLCAAPNTRGAVLSGRRVETLQRRLRLHRLGYVGVNGAEVQNFGLRLVTEPDLELAEQGIGRLRKSCARVPAFEAAGIVLEDRVWSLVLHLRHAATADQIAAAEHFGRLAAAEGLRLGRGNEAIEASAQARALVARRSGSSRACARRCRSTWARETPTKRASPPSSVSAGSPCTSVRRPGRGPPRAGTSPTAARSSD